MRRVENRAGRLQAIAQRRQALLGHVEDQVALGRRILGQPFQVVLDTGEGVGQRVQTLPAGHGLTHQQLFADVAAAGIQQGSGPRQRNHAQPPAHLGQQFGDPGQVLVIPLRGDELDDRVLGLFQPGARLLDHQLVNLPHVGGRQQAFLGMCAL
ncbi:hypothetical protein D3C78_1167550 [compost metagenome]